MQPKRKSELKSVILWTSTILFAVGLLSVRVVIPEILWATVVCGVLELTSLGLLIRENHQALRSRSMAFGVQSGITVLLVLGIVGVLNFLVSQHPLKKDLTANKSHTFSDDTARLMKGLKSPIKATLYAKMSERERVRGLLDNYKSANPSKFEYEWVDPDKDTLRTRQNGIKKYGTLHLQWNGKDSKVEELSEEKITNALIKLLKEKSSTLCVVTGHGERALNGTDAEGMASIKKGLEDQAYVLKEFNLGQDAGSISSCDALAIVGPNKAFFDKEIQTLREYLDNGGHALIAIDLAMKGPQYVPELDAVLADWHIKRVPALVVDPFAQQMGGSGNAAVPKITRYSSENAITRDMRQETYFPFVQPIDVVPGAPEGLSVSWLAQTTNQAWGITNLKGLAEGQVRDQKNTDIKGPLNIAAAAEGKRKDSKAAKKTRLAVFGTSFFATNNFSRFGANIDLFTNAVQWLLEDESFISIHSKEESPGKLELSATEVRLIGLVNMGLLPLATLITGITIWFRRRRL